VGHLPASLYDGDRFDTSCAVIVPSDPDLVPALWAFVSSAEFVDQVRQLDRKLNVTNATLAKVPFDKAKWQAIARGLARSQSHGRTIRRSGCSTGGPRCQRHRYKSRLRG